MDWIRRNWPDVLIGVALLAVIAGIIATLLSGGSFLPFARNNPPAVSTSSSTPTTTSSLPPASTDAASNTVENAANAVSNAVDNATENVADAANTVATTTAEGAENAATAAETVVQPVIPDLPTIEGSAETEGATTPEATPQASTEAATSTAAATSAAPVNTSSSASGAYRISVGAFGNRENADRRAATFRDAGYPVFLADQGSLSIVLVGPYDSESEAEQARAQIVSSGLESSATLFKYDASTATGEVVNAGSSQTAPATANSATDNGATEASSAPAQNTVTTTTSPTAAPPTASSGRYLQVGAYGSIESSMPQRQRLEAMGYTVVHIDESGLIKLLVGPFDSNNLGVAQSQLSSQGIESFVR